MDWFLPNWGQLSHQPDFQRNIWYWYWQCRWQSQMAMWIFACISGAYKIWSVSCYHIILLHIHLPDICSFCCPKGPNQIFSQQPKMNVWAVVRSHRCPLYHLRWGYAANLPWWHHHMEKFFHVTVPLWRESTGHMWIPFTKASDVELWCFLWFAPE